MDKFKVQIDERKSGGYTWIVTNTQTSIWTIGTSRTKKGAVNNAKRWIRIHASRTEVAA